jgi:CheY-like chemotaxis protein
VLVCDDEEPVLDVVSRMLASLGCRVLTARSGDEVIERYRQHSAEVRLVLIDLVMPRLSGEQVLCELRRLSAELPVLIMSGYPQEEVAARLAPLGLTGCLQKPFRLPTLVEAVRRYLVCP